MHRDGVDRDSGTRIPLVDLSIKLLSSDILYVAARDCL